MLELKGKHCKDCKVFTNEVEDSALATIYNILDTKEFKDSKVRIMPDVHAGTNSCIGFSAPLLDAVNPSMVGVDVGCTIDTWITDITINKDWFPLIDHRIKKDIPFGFNVNAKRQFETKEFIKYLKSYYSKARSTWSEMIDDIEISEKSISEMLRRLGMDEGLFYKSIGSVGGGNHFIEIGDYDGSFAFTIHCGSRNFGQKVCKYWEKIASSNKADNKLLKEAIKRIKANTPKEERHTIPSQIKAWEREQEEKSNTNGYLSGEKLKGYLSDMVIATAYALYNHEINVIMC